MTIPDLVRQAVRSPSVGWYGMTLRAAGLELLP
jgi:hypothetical protein